MKSKTKISTKKLALTAMFIALNVIFMRLLMIETIVFRVSFASVMFALSGIVLGPVFGAIAVFSADFLGFMMRPSPGAYFIGYPIGFALATSLHGVMLHGRYSLRRLIVTLAITSVVVDFGLHTFLWMPFFIPGFGWTSMTVFTGTGWEFSAAVWKVLAVRTVVLYPVFVALVHFVVKALERRGGADRSL